MKAPTIVKKERSVFPPAQTPRKIDLEMESGEYFLKQEEREGIKREKKQVITSYLFIYLSLSPLF